MKILLVEDEKKVLSFLKKGFREHGFCVDTAGDGQDGFFLAAGEHYDCILLDIMMPKLDGHDMVAQLRKKGVRTPVIFLTAKDTVGDRVRGLELGADDYVVKPFAFSEVLARVRAVVRRGGELKTQTLRVGELEMDPARRTVLRSGKKIDLTPKEFTLLQYLAERPGEVVTRTMLSENVWGYHFDSMTNVIDVHINNLRKKVDGQSPKPMIHTVRGVGYMIEAHK